jgi:hypothetical protein
MLHAKRHLLHRSLNTQLNNEEGIASYLVSDALPCFLLERYARDALGLWSLFERCITDCAV